MAGGFVAATLLTTEGRDRPAGVGIFGMRTSKFFRYSLYDLAFGSSITASLSNYDIVGAWDWWSAMAGFDNAAFIRLVADLFGIWDQVLAAVLLNEIGALSWNDSNLAYKYGSDRQTFGIAQLSYVTVFTRLNPRYFLSPTTKDGTIARLKDFKWGVVYAAAWLGDLTFEFARQAGSKFSFEDYTALLAGYRGGEYKHQVLENLRAGVCGGCGSIAEEQLRDVMPDFYDGNVEIVAGRLHETGPRYPDPFDAARQMLPPVCGVCNW